MVCSCDVPSQEGVRDALVAVEGMRKTRHPILSAKEDFASEDSLTSTADSFNQGMQLTLRFAPG